MESETVSLSTHEEFERRMDDNIRAQNQLIADLNNRVNETHAMAASVERLAASMENMVKVQGTQGEDIKEIRNKVEAINIEHIEITLNEHGARLVDHENRIREQELKPQDSTDHENRIRALEAKPAKNWEKIVAGIIAGVVAFIVGAACSNIFGG